MRAQVLLALFAVFAPISLMTIGGGQSITSELHRQAVVEQGWVTEAGFIYAYAVSRLAPGPGSLLVALIGWDAAGLAGAVVASVAIFLPSSLLLYGVVRLWMRYRGAPWLGAVERGLAPLAAGLILSASLTLVEAARGGWLAWVVALGATLVLATTRVSPFPLLGAGAAVFVGLRLLL